MKYVQYLNARFRDVLERSDKFIVYGQNVGAGSCLSGLTRGFPKTDRQWVLNTPNIENTLVGAGFGMMLNGVSSAYFMKQQDFLLLGIDQLVNTYNFVRIGKPEASFTIVTVVVDSGYEGIQSSLNNFSDFCSIARIDGYTITNKHDAEEIIGTQFIKPGFRIIGVSQRLFGTEILSMGESVHTDENNHLFKYTDGEDITIVCFNFSLPQGYELYSDLKEKGVQASLFSINLATPVTWDLILESVHRTKRLVIMDDGKSVHRSGYHLSNVVRQERPDAQVLLLVRDFTEDDLRPNAEIFSVDMDAVMAMLG